MESPVRKMLKRNDYNRHKLLRKIKRQRKARAEQESKAAEKELKKRLRWTPLKKYEDGKDGYYTAYVDDINQTRVNPETGDVLVLDQNGSPIINEGGYLLPEVKIYGQNIKKANDEAALQRAFQLSEIWNDKAYPGHGALEIVSPEFDALTLGGSVKGIYSFAKKAVNTVNKNYVYPYKLSRAINQGVSENGIITGYNRNPRNLDTGSLSDYQSYLDDVFSNSKVNDIQWHGGLSGIEKLKNPGKGFHNDPVTSDLGIYVTPEKWSAQRYQEALLSNILNLKDFTKAKFNSRFKHNILNKKTDLYPVKVNIEHPIHDSHTGHITKEKIYGLPDNFGFINNDRFHPETVVINPEQSLILGSNEDVVGFNNWIKKRSK